MVLVMEFAAGGELYDYLSERKVLSEEEARRIFRQVATAVYYCHKHKICHRDLKLENILLDEHGNAKVSERNLTSLPLTFNPFCFNPFSDCRFWSLECVRRTKLTIHILRFTTLRLPRNCWRHSLPRSRGRLLVPWCAPLHSSLWINAIWWFQF